MDSGRVTSFSSLPPERQAQMLADSSLGACRRNREGCIELGPWRPFYQGYVCDACLHADQDDLHAHGRGELGRWPFRKE
jgi:hypothetical protein